MNALYKAIAIMALCWAFFAPAYLILSNLRDAQAHKLQALARIRLGASADEMTNNVIKVPSGSVEIIQNLALRESIRSTRFILFAIASSFVIVILAKAVLSPLRGPNQDASGKN